jgi:hypothetical protein
MRTWAIIVGINEYPAATGQNALKGAVADALDFADWALHPDGGGVDPQRLFLWTYPPAKPDAATPAVAAYMAAPPPWSGQSGLVGPPDRPPTVAEILDTALLAAQDALMLGNEDGEESRCYILLAGHGMQARVIGAQLSMQTCFLAGDFKLHPTITGLLPGADLRDGLLAHGFNEVFLFLDCCRTTIPIYNAQVLPLGFPAIKAPPKPRWSTGWAADSDSTAWETPHDAPTRGAFTQLLVEGLRQARSPDTNSLTLELLDNYVANRIAAAVAPKEQFPIIHGHPHARRLVVVQTPKIPLSGPPAVAPVVVNCRRVPAGMMLRMRDKNDNEVANFKSNGDEIVQDAASGHLYSIESDDGAFEQSFMHAGQGETHVDL